MNPDARRENARRLANLLGTDQELAAAKLDRTVVVTAGSAHGDTEAAEFVARLLARTFSNVIRGPAREEAAAEVVIGSARPTTRAPVVNMEFANGCIAIGGPRGGVYSDDPMPRIFVALGAAYAAAAAVRAALGSDAALLPPPSTITLDPTELLGTDIARVNDPFDFGTAFLAGAGAIANGFVLGLTLLKPRGTLHVCDPDVIKGGNLNRCYLFTDSDLGTNKARRLSEAAAGSAPGITFVPHAKELSMAVNDSGVPLERLVSTVDSRRARRNLQEEAPLLVFDASTTGIEELVVHFNDIRRDLACMSCVYHHERNETAHEQHIADALGVPVEKLRENWIDADAARAISARHPDVDPNSIICEAYDSLFRERCGEGRLPRESDPDVLAPFGFISTMAGLYLALEFARRVRCGNQVAPFNYWRASPWRPPVFQLRQTLPRRADCAFCGNVVRRKAARRLWGAADARS